MATLNEIKKRLAPWFMSHGLVSGCNKRIWFEDNGFYLTVVEIQPCKGMGFIINVGVNFLWKEFFGVSYDFAIKDIEVTVPNALFGAVMFDSENFEAELEYVLSETEKRIALYRELKDISVLDKRLESRCDAIVFMNKDFLKKDTSRGITRALLGDIKTASEILLNDSAENRVAKLLYGLLGSDDDFKKALRQIISNCRTNFEIAQRVKFKQNDIMI